MTGVYGGGENHVFGKRERIPWISAVFSVQSPFIRRRAARQRKKISSYAAAISEEIADTTKRDYHSLKPCESRPMAARGGWRIMRYTEKKNCRTGLFTSHTAEIKNSFIQAYATTQRIRAPSLYMGNKNIQNEEDMK